jgi:hypothetical protein
MRTLWRSYKAGEWHTYFILCDWDSGILDAPNTSILATSLQLIKVWRMKAISKHMGCKVDVFYVQLRHLEERGVQAVMIKEAVGNKSTAIKIGCDLTIKVEVASTFFLNC